MAATFNSELILRQLKASRRVVWASVVGCAMRTNDNGAWDAPYKKRIIGIWQRDEAAWNAPASIDNTLMRLV